MMTRTKGSVGTLVMAAGVVLLTIVGLFSLGRRDGDSDLLDGVDVANAHDGSGRNHDVVRRFEPIEPIRSESNDAASGAVAGERGASVISGVVRANGRPLSSAILFCDPWFGEPSVDVSKMRTLEGEIQPRRSVENPFDRTNEGISELEVPEDEEDLNSNFPILGGIGKNRLRPASDGAFKFDCLAPGIYLIGVVVRSGTVRHFQHQVVHVRTETPSTVEFDLSLCRVDVVADGMGLPLTDTAWRIVDEDGRIFDRRDVKRSAARGDPSALRRRLYLPSGRRYRVEVCSDGHHPSELDFVLKAGQREARIEAVLRVLDPTGSLRVRFEGAAERRLSLVQFRIGSTEGSRSGTEGSRWIDERMDVASGTLELDGDGTAVLRGLALRTKRLLLAIEIPDFPLTDCLRPEAVQFVFIEGGMNDVSIRLESGGHLKAIVRFPIDPAESAKVSIESADGHDLSEPVGFIWSFDSFGGRRLRDLALRQPTGDRADPVDRPLRTLRPLRPGRYILSITAPGLETERAAFEIKAAATSEIEITMRHE